MSQNSVPVKKISKSKRRRLPPGQRLIVYVSCALLGMALQGFFIPAETTSSTGATAAGLSFNRLPQRVLESPFLLQHNLDSLEAALTKECNKPKLVAGIFAVEPKTGSYVSVLGQEKFSAASMIKVPVFAALLQALDKHQVRMDEILTIKNDLIGGGSGCLQWRTPGSKISLKETAELMIKISDNTATNIIIDRLGGIAVLNKQFEQWGLAKTKINNLLPDFDGTNTTSPYDLVCLLGEIDRGGILSHSSRKYMYEIMEQTRTRTLLPPGLGPGAKIAHKTGDIASMVGDSGIITDPAGVRYLVAVQVTRPTNDRRANQLIRDVSKLIYDDFTSGKPE